MDAFPAQPCNGVFHGLITPMLTGGRCVLQLRFKADEAVELINRENVSWSCGATPFVHDLLKYLEESGRAIPTLKYFLCGGAPVPGSLIEMANRHGFLLCELYGSTESALTCAFPARSALSGTAVSRASRIPGSR